MLKLNSIVLLIPYYGKWNNYIDIYVKTCSYNNFIDIIFITDLPPIEDAPKNIKFTYITFLEVKTRIENLFSIKLPHISPYKLCDYRPAYATIFSKEIALYNFWGYGDCDLIYGDLQKFLSQETLDANDIIFFRKDHLHGPFTLYKNIDKVNKLYIKSSSFLKIFSHPNYLSFDEFGTKNFKYKKGIDFEQFQDDNISYLAFKEYNEGSIKLSFEPVSKEVISATKDIIVFNNGKVSNYNTKDEYGFYHWVIEKRALWFIYPKWDIVPNIFYVSETGFYTQKQFKYYKFIHVSRKLKGSTQWMYLKITNYIKRKMKINIIVDTYPNIGFVKAL